MGWEFSKNGIGNTHKILVRTPEDRRPTGGHGKSNIVMDLKEKWCSGVSGCHLPQGRVLWWLYGKQIFGSMKDWEFSDQVGDYQFLQKDCSMVLVNISTFYTCNYFSSTRNAFLLL